MNKNDDNLELAYKKLAALEKALIKETKADEKFRLNEEITQLKQLITELTPETTPMCTKEV